MTDDESTTAGGDAMDVTDGSSSTATGPGLEPPRQRALRQMEIALHSAGRATHCLAFTTKTWDEKTQTYTVCVPHQVEKQIEVKVCKMVAQQVEAPCGCGAAPACGCGG